MGSFFCLCLCLCRGCSHLLMLMLCLCLCLCLCACENQPAVTSHAPSSSVLLWLRVGLPLHWFLMAGFGSSSLTFAGLILWYVCNKRPGVLAQQTELNQSNAHMIYMHVVFKCQERSVRNKIHKRFHGSEDIFIILPMC